MFFFNLDKKFTVRYILWFLFILFVFFALIYFCLLIRRDWNVVMGGVGYGNSPYKDIIPEQCLNYSGGHTGMDSENPLAREGFRAFQFRTYVLKIETYAKHVDCSGYKLLTGLHGDKLASYRNIYIGINGEPLVLEVVEYHTEKQPRNLTKRR